MRTIKRHQKATALVMKNMFETLGELHVLPAKSRDFTGIFKHFQVPSFPNTL